MSLKSKCYNYRILRTVLEMIDSMFCYIEDKITVLGGQSFSTTNFLFPFQKGLTITTAIPEDGLETS